MLKTIFPRTTPPQWHDLVDRKPWLLHDDPAPHINEIFKTVKSSFQYQQDPPGQDSWGSGTIKKKSLSKGHKLIGDCDDFAVEILKHLKLHGAKSSELALVICKNAKGQSHMVAALVRENETLIFDNTKNKVATASDPQFEGYEWGFMNKGNKWFSVIMNR
ncbi:MAG: transglutaminase-like cysteine peptidase [Halopseudomonas aestusnigri]